MLLEDLICNVYTYIECSQDFDIYNRMHKDSTTIENLKAWDDIESAYKEVSGYMTDESIAQIQSYVIHER